MPTPGVGKGTHLSCCDSSKLWLLVGTQGSASFTCKQANRNFRNTLGPSCYVQPLSLPHASYCDPNSLPPGPDTAPLDTTPLPVGGRHSLTPGPPAPAPVASRAGGQWAALPAPTLPQSPGSSGHDACTSLSACNPHCGVCLPTVLRERNYWCPHVRRGSGAPKGQGPVQGLSRGPT